jgi:hypothetical protein
MFAENKYLLFRLKKQRKIRVTALPMNASITRIALYPKMVHPVF